MKFLSFLHFFLLTCFLILTSFTSYSQEELRLPNFFTNDMVLQRDAPINLWGWSNPRQVVEVEIKGSKLRTTSDGKGKWKLQLPSFPAGGPLTIKINSGASTLVLSNVLMGDVWICGGQSNMELPIKLTHFVENDTAWLKKQQIRFLKVQPEMDYLPKEDIVSRGWIIPELEEIKNFTAVGYHFGKFIQQKSGVPIGLISANLGATAIETWMSNEALEKFEQFHKEVAHSESFKQIEEAFEDSKPQWYESYYFTGIGIEEKWYLPETDITSWESIEVAGNTWEAEENLKDFDGAVWFRSSFDLPQGFQSDSLELQLLQIDDYDITWVNGERIGETYGRHNHRNYKVSAKILKEKGNSLVIRVFDTGGLGGFTTSAFWGNEILWGSWKYKKGLKMYAKQFLTQKLVNVSPFSSPAVLYNGTIAPLTSLEIKGVIWYQGESNVARAEEYQKLFPALIQDWRKNFDKEITFLWVQLANYGKEPEKPGASSWAELREAQSLALSLPKTGMAVSIDIGEADDIHPKNKLEVGKRLGALAMNIDYNGNFPATGPRFKNIEKKGDSLVVSFSFSSDSLKTIDKYGYVKGFQIAGNDKKFHWAKALIKENKVVVYRKGLQNPVAIRYGWSDNPGPLDLTGQSGLPAEPFRSDSWELSTRGAVFTDDPRF